MTNTAKVNWTYAPFTVLRSDGTQMQITVKGRNRWALECLISAGSKGCTPIDHPGPRWSAYKFNLKELGVEIDKITEMHDGPFQGHHARYVLISRVIPSAGGAIMKALRIAWIRRTFGVSLDQAVGIASLVYGEAAE